MAKILKMPVLGQSVEEVRIIQWLKKEGDAVQVGDNLAEIETDKVATFFESPESGFLRKILVAADSFVAVEAPVVILTATIDEVLEDGAQKEAPVQTPESESINASKTPAPTTVVSPSAGATIVASPRARRVAGESAVPLELLSGKGTGIGGRIQAKDVLAFASTQQTTVLPDRSTKVSPLARAVAEGAGIDLASLSGTGTGGRIVAEDVHARVAPTPIPPDVSRDAATGKRVITLSGLRKRVADNILKSVQRAPHVTLHLSVDMGAAMELRKTLLPIVEKKTSVRLSPTDIIVKAVAIALTEHPYMNSHIEGDTITIFDSVHIGLAVSLGEDGLIVPLIRNADKKGLADIAKNRDDIAKRARANTLTPQDIQGGTFSVSNLGNYGIEGFNPIIAPPQVGILGVGGIIDSVVPRNGIPSVRPMMVLSLSFDHRATDGAPAAAFLSKVKEILETPMLLAL